MPHPRASQRPGPRAMAQAPSRLRLTHPPPRLVEGRLQARAQLGGELRDGGAGDRRARRARRGPYGLANYHGNLARAQPAGTGRHGPLAPADAHRDDGHVHPQGDERRAVEQRLDDRPRAPGALGEHHDRLPPGQGHLAAAQGFPVGRPPACVGPADAPELDRERTEGAEQAGRPPLGPHLALAHEPYPPPGHAGREQGVQVGAVDGGQHVRDRLGEVLPAVDLRPPHEPGQLEHQRAGKAVPGQLSPGRWPPGRGLCRLAQARPALVARSSTRSTTSPTLLEVVSTTTASGAALMGEARRLASMWSRRAMSAATSSKFMSSTSRLRRVALSSSLAVRYTLSGASGNTTVPMSLPSTTPPPWERPHSCWRRTSSRRTSGLAATTLTARLTSGPRISMVASTPSTSTRSATSRSRAAASLATCSASSGSTPRRMAVKATARYIAPVSR